MLHYAKSSATWKHILNDICKLVNVLHSKTSTHLHYVAVWWPQNTSSWRSEHPGQSGLVHCLSYGWDLMRWDCKTHKNNRSKFKYYKRLIFDWHQNKEHSFITSALKTDRCLPPLKYSCLSSTTFYTPHTSHPIQHYVGQTPNPSYTNRWQGNPWTDLRAINVQTHKQTFDTWYIQAFTHR